MQSEPQHARTLVWALPFSLAATHRIDIFSFSSSGYLDVSVHRVPSAYLWIQYTVTEVCSAGFPHSDICGSRDICSSPQLFAAYRVFHRLLVPRHPPCALYSLTCCNSSFFGLVTSIHSVVCLFIWNLHFFFCLFWMSSRLSSSIRLVLTNQLFRRWYFKIIFNIRFSRYIPDWNFISHSKSGLFLILNHW